MIDFWWIREYFWYIYIYHIQSQSENYVVCYSIYFQTSVHCKSFEAFTEDAEMQGTYQVCTAENAKETNRWQHVQQIFDDSIETITF